jgi:hypothetical protein
VPARVNKLASVLKGRGSSPALRFFPVLLFFAPGLPPAPPTWRERDVVVMGIIGAILLVVGIVLVLVVRRFKRDQDVSDETLDGS